MTFNDVDKSKPYTVLMVTEPIRLACLSFAGFPRGVYYIQGDFRSKITKVHDRRLVEAGLLALRFVSDLEKPDDFVKSEEIRVANAQEVSEDPPSSGVDATPPVEMMPIPGEPSRTSPLRVPSQPAVEVTYDPTAYQTWGPGVTIGNVNTPYPASTRGIQQGVEPLPAPVAPTPTEVPAIPTEVPPVATEQPFVVTPEPPLVSTTLVVPTEVVPIPTEVTLVTVDLTDHEPLVILDDQPPAAVAEAPAVPASPPVSEPAPEPKAPKKPRGRKPKQGNVVAPADGEAKLTEHEQDRRSAEPAAAASDQLPDQNRISNENSQALA